MRYLLFSSLSILFLLCSCGEEVRQTETKNQVSDIDTIFPEYAQGFRILHAELANTLEILDSSGQVSYSIHIENSSGPKRFACLSTTHASMLHAIEMDSAICGMAFADRVLDSTLKSSINGGRIADLGDGSMSSMEKILQSQPDIYFVYPYGNEDYSRLESSGIQCVPVAEYTESHPLGRAEWILFFGAIAGRLELAQMYFSDIEDAYNETLERADLVEFKPEVFTGSSYQSEWYAPSGESLIARFIEDAGAEYSFIALKGHDNLQLEFEVMLSYAHDADFWGEVLYEQGKPDIKRILQAEPRLSSFRAFKEEGSGIFYCNAFETDYFGDGVLRPDVILADLFAIFHPELSPDYEPSYFRKLKQE